MCYPVCGMVHIKEPLLIIGKNSPCSDGSENQWPDNLIQTGDLIEIVIHHITIKIL